MVRLDQQYWTLCCVFVVKEDFADIRAYFSTTKWNRLCMAEKKRFLQIKENHLVMSSLGKPLILKYYFTEYIAIHTDTGGAAVHITAVCVCVCVCVCCCLCDGKKGGVREELCVCTCMNLSVTCV